MSTKALVGLNSFLCRLDRSNKLRKKSEIKRSNNCNKLRNHLNSLPEELFAIIASFVSNYDENFNMCSFVGFYCKKHRVIYDYRRIGCYDDSMDIFDLCDYCYREHEHMRLLEEKLERRNAFNEYVNFLQSEDDEHLQKFPDFDEKFSHKKRSKKFKQKY